MSIIKNSEEQRVEIVAENGDRYTLRVKPGKIVADELASGKFNVNMDAELISFTPAAK